MGLRDPPVISSYCPHFAQDSSKCNLFLVDSVVITTFFSSGNRVDLEWRYCADGETPDRAVLGGSDPSGEKYYIGRASHRGDTIPGKVHKSHKCLYIPYGGRELKEREYGVLFEA